MPLRPVPLNGRPRLRDSDARPSAGLLPSNLEAEQKRLLDRLEKLQCRLYAEAKRALLVVLQARDAGGKDGTIKKVFGPLNPQGCVVTSFGVPTKLELAHDFLWRVHNAVPPRGAIGIFNRSHYEDVLVVRVKNLVPRSVWATRYQQINDFERMLARNDVVIAKFFLHISREEQRRRLLDRLKDPTENWKFRSGDLEDRALWPRFTSAYRDALARCSTRWAPWYVVPADKKSIRNYLVTEVLVRTLERMNPTYPRADPQTLALARRLV